MQIKSETSDLSYWFLPSSRGNSYIFENTERMKKSVQLTQRRYSSSTPEKRNISYSSNVRITGSHKRVFYRRRTSSLPSCLWSQKDLPISPRFTPYNFYRDASSLLQLVNQWSNFTYSRSHAFRYERKNTNPTLVRIELTTSALAGVQVTY